MDTNNTLESRIIEWLEQNGTKYESLEVEAVQGEDNYPHLIIKIDVPVAELAAYGGAFSGIKPTGEYIDGFEEG